MITLAGAEKRLSAAFPIQKSIDLTITYPTHRVQGHRHAQDGMGQRRQLESFTSDRSVAADSFEPFLASEKLPLTACATP